MKLFLTKTILVLTLILAVSSCHKTTNEPIKINTQLNDSIALWLKKSKKVSQKKYKENLDKAYLEVKKMGNDSLVRKYLHRISYKYLLNKRFKEFRDSNAYLIGVSEEEKDSVKLAGAYWDLGYYYEIRSKIDSSYYSYAKAQKLYEALGSFKNEGKIWINIANIQSKAKDYKSSEVSSTNALLLLKSLPDTEREIFDSYNNLGSVSNSMNKHDKALEYYNQALTYQKQIKKKNTLDLYVLNNIGNVYGDKKEYGKAIEYYKKVLATDSLLLKKPSFYAKVLDNLGFYRFKNKEIINAERQLLRSLTIRDSIQDISGIAISNYNLAEYYLEKKDSAKALEHAKKSEYYSKLSKNNKRLLQVYNLLTSLDPDKASDYSHKYIQLNDSLLQAERNLQDKFALIRFETDEVLEENEALEKEKQLLASLVIGSLLVVLAIIIIGGQYFRNQKLKFERAQQENNLETFNLMLSQKEQLALAKQEEQKRISQELHDGAVGTLTGIGMILKITNESADDKAIAERTKLIAQLQETAEEIRGISHVLSAASSKKIQNFTYSIQELMDNTQKASGIRTTFTYDETINWDALDGTIKINLYRIIQEVVQNSVKHAQAKNITLDFSGDSSNLYVILSDDGIGFNPKKRKKGIGQKNIYSRVKSINASLAIDSVLNQGTKISITLPPHTNTILENQGNEKS